MALWITAALLIIAAAMTWMTRQARAKPEVHYDTASVDRGTIAAKVTATGNLPGATTLRGLQFSGQEGPASSTATAATGALTLLLAAIAAVSLLVGGIGIMNIMLVSVTERTREIGLCMAIGAKGRHILAQFLAESLVLAVTGGIIGMLLGISVTQLLARHFGWTIPVRPEVVVLAIGFSMLAGVGFGLFPARKASRLDPIVALRYE